MKSLRKARKENGLTQTELAKLAGVSTLTISFIETGKSAPKIGTKKKIEEALGERIDWSAGKENFYLTDLDYNKAENLLRKILVRVLFFKKKDKLAIAHLLKQYVQNLQEGLKI